MLETRRFHTPRVLTWYYEAPIRSVVASDSSDLWFICVMSLTMVLGLAIDGYCLPCPLIHFLYLAAFNLHGDDPMPVLVVLVKPHHLRSQFPIASSLFQSSNPAGERTPSCLFAVWRRK